HYPSSSSDYRACPERQSNGSIAPTFIAFAVKIENDEGYTEEWLENSLQDGETELGQAGRLIFRHARHHFLQNNLRILGDAQLVEGISDYGPFRNQSRPHRDDRDSQSEREPD